MTKKATALLETHRELGARLTPFGGWEMPLQYEGIVAEHHVVRKDCGLFDVSHLGKLLLQGEKGTVALQQTVTADVDSVEVGQARYALVLTDDAGCVDDIFIYRIAEHEWLVVPNASNVEAVARAVSGSGGDPQDAWDRWSILALQGPRSFEIFDEVFPGTPATQLKLHRWVELELGSDTTIVARTGYTGERGFELYVPTAEAVSTFRALLEAGAAPVGLGARDTLRLEMGYALYGHELTLGTNPLEAGLGWAISWDAPFRGRERLEEIREQGPERRSVGIKLHERGVPRAGYRVHFGDVIGEITSGNFSPTLGVGIALAFFPAQDAPPPGELVEIEARGRLLQGDIVKPPFIERGVKK
jgi:aminomethyltransferase